MPCELCCPVGWIFPGLDRVAETAGEAFCDEGAVAFAGADDPRECTDATAEAECVGDPPLQAAVSKTKAATHIRRHRFLCHNRSFVSAGADRREYSMFNSPRSPPGDNNYLPRG